MFNYKYGSNMTYWEYDETTNEFIVTATEVIKQGQEVRSPLHLQIFVSYGKKASSKFLLFYGFVPEENDKNVVEFPIFFNSTDSLKQLKEKAVACETNPRLLKANANTDDTLFQELISYLRFVEFTGTPEDFTAVTHPPPSSCAWSVGSRPTRAETEAEMEAETEAGAGPGSSWDRT